MMRKTVQLLKANAAVLIVCLLTIFALLPLFQPGFFSMHDNEQVGRLYDLNQTLIAGNFPPRIAPNLGFGYGYPFFNFYPSFVYYVAEIFLLVGFSYIGAVKMMIAVGFILAAVAMYFFARKYVSTMGAIIAAVAYTYAPYHSVDVYVRGALPEFWSFVFLPAIFWSMKCLKDTSQQRFIVLMGLFGAGLILTHNLVAVMSAIFIFGYFCLLVWETKNKQTFLTQVVLAGLLSLSLSAYFWLPSYGEKQYTMIELLTKDLADYRQHFVYLRQFWNSPWGYGGSLYGLYDGLSFEIGKLHIIGAALAAVVFILVKRQRVILGFFLAALALAAFMATFRSQFIWDALQPLSYIQFPWRFLLFTAFFSSMLIGFVLSAIPFKKNYSIGILVGVLLILFYKDNFKPEKYFLTATDQNYIAEEYIRWDTSKLAAEYVPLGIATRKTDIGTLIVDINQNEIASSSHTLISGKLSKPVEVRTNLPQTKSFVVVAETPVLLRINSYGFPGWKVHIDGIETVYNDKNKFKLMTVAIPPGKHTVIAQFTDTPIRIIGNTLSIIGILSLIFFGIWVKLTQKKDQKQGKST